jgi:hypothetical protein
MPLSPEIVIFITLIAALVLYLAYIRPKAKQQKLRLMTRYRKIRNKSLSLQDKLSGYILANDKLNDTFLKGITYGQYLEALKQDYALHLGERMYLEIQSQNKVMPMRKLNRKIDIQEQRLKKVEKELSFVPDKPVIPIKNPVVL